MIQSKGTERLHLLSSGSKILGGKLGVSFVLKRTLNPQSNKAYQAEKRSNSP